MPGVAIKDFSAHLVTGDIEHFISYVPDGDGDKEAAIILAPRNWMLHGKKCYIIPLRCAHTYYPQTFVEKGWVMRHCKMISMALTGSHLSTPDVLKAIEARLPDVVEAAEYQMIFQERKQDAPPVVGDVEIRSDGELINLLPLHQEFADYDLTRIDDAAVH